MKEGETMTGAQLEVEVLEPYCKNNMQLLKKISRSIFLKLGETLSESDYDDFYSIANMTLWQAYNSYNSDMGISFDVFLHGCIKRKFKTEIRDRHRAKRVISQFAISLDDSDGNDNDMYNFIPSNFDTFEEATNNQFQDKAQQYISKLSSQQVNILNLLMDGYEPKDIRQILEISSKEYAENMKIMRSFENVKILF